MRYRLMASYRGSPFEAGVGPTDGDIVLFAACPPPEDLGFEPATGHWRKQLRINEVQAVWQSRPVGTFRGDRCVVLDDLGDRLHIGYLGHDAYRAEQLGYWQVDRGVFELVAARNEVGEIVEERAEFPAAAEPADNGAAANRAGATAEGWQPSAAAASHADSAGGAQPAPPLTAESSYFAPASPAAAPADVESQPQDDFASFTRPAGPDTGSYTRPAGFERGDFSLPAAPTTGGFRAVKDEITGFAIPDTAEPPLPLEAAALRAAAQARQPRPAARQPGAGQPAADPVAGQPAAAASARVPAAGQAPLSRSRRSADRRLATESHFSELAGLAGIAPESYAFGEEADGAMCLLQTDAGFEVFHSATGNRHELQVFATEEAACFYLFGLLAAEAVRNGSLVPGAGHSAPVPAARLRTKWQVLRSGLGRE